MKTETILGHTVEYNFFDSKDREMNDADIEHVATLLAEGYVEGELNQYDHKTDDDIRGYWKKV